MANRVSHGHAVEALITWSHDTDVIVFQKAPCEARDQLLLSGRQSTGMGGWYARIVVSSCRGLGLPCPPERDLSCSAI